MMIKQSLPIRILCAMLLNIALCMAYTFSIDRINSCMPLVHWDVAMGLTFRFSVVVLFVAMLSAMALHLYTKKKYIPWLPAIFPLLYWVNCLNLFPYTSVAFAGLNIVIYSIYILGISWYS